MCNHCDSTGIISIEEYEPDQDDYCEFVAESDADDDEDLYLEETPSCLEEPKFIVVETFVEEHLCDQHAKIVSEQELVTDYMTEAAGLGTARLETIESGEPITCEFFDVMDPDAGECTAPATHALIVEIETLLCPEHLEEYQSSDN
jgi:hypothetical protein